MQIEYIETNRTALDQTPKYFLSDTLYDNNEPIKVRANTFSYKVEGKRYLDGEYMNDWVQYI